MIELIDKRKISLKGVKSVLEGAGFKRTTSRRYMRYEREAVDCFGDAYIEGVEIEKYDAYTSIASVYVRGDGYMHNELCALSDSVHKLFAGSEYHPQ